MQIGVRINIAINLRFWRKRQGLTQEDLALRAMLNKATVYNYESRRYHGTPNIEYLGQLANALGLRITDLIEAPPLEAVPGGFSFVHPWLVIGTGQALNGEELMGVD